MMTESYNKLKYEFDSKLWQYPGKGGWCFVLLPNEIAKEIRDNLKSEEEGWGRLKVIAKIGTAEWKTSIWFDTKMDTYLLPIKAEIRKKELLQVDSIFPICIWI